MEFQEKDQFFSRFNSFRRKYGVILLLLSAMIGGFFALLYIMAVPHQKLSKPVAAGPSDEELKSMFRNYTLAFGKRYYGNDEELKRISSFKTSLKMIQQLNGGQHGHLLRESGVGDDTSNAITDGGNIEVKNMVKWTEGMPKNMGLAKWGLTAFADLSPVEFKQRYLDPGLLNRILTRHNQQSHHRHHYKHRNHGEEQKDGDVHNQTHRGKRSVLPEKVDWRDKQIVSPVKHQKDCGACWAFSTVETVESMQALATGHLQELSVQQVIDCSKNGNSGCSGGDTCAAVEWMANRKLSPESKYPLTLKDGSCRLQSSAVGVQVARNFSCSRLIDEEDKVLELLATHGPVTVAVDATNWQYYVGGVIQWNCETSVNHAVQIVGYDMTTNPNHYIVRNSWGPTFGDKGYLYIATNKNLCGIATEVVWLSVE